MYKMAFTHLYCALRTCNRLESPFHRFNLPFSFSSCLPCVLISFYMHSTKVSIIVIHTLTNADGKIRASSLLPLLSNCLTEATYRMNWLFVLVPS